MATFVFIWDPTNSSYPADDYAADVAVTAAGGTVDGRWSTGSRRRLVDGEVFLDRHFEDPSRLKSYTRICWELLVPADDRLPLEELLRDVPGHAWNAVYGSGQQVRPPADVLLDEVWHRHLERIGR
jgi:hypothetical protein